MKTTIEKIWRLGMLFLVAFNLLLGVGVAAPNQPTFTSIDVRGAMQTRAMGINPAGDIVGRYTSADGKTHGYLLSQGSFTTIDFPGAIFTIATGINPAGDIVGWYTDTRGTHGYLVSGGSFTTVEFPGHVNTQAVRINPNGEIVGCYHDTCEGPGFLCSTMHGYRLSGGTFTSFDLLSSMNNGIHPGGDRGVVCRDQWENPWLSAEQGRQFHFHRCPWQYILTTVWDVNPAGEIVGFYTDTSGTHGFLLSRKK